MKKNIFEKRFYIKPYEYPELSEFVDAIRHSYWLHTEFNYTSDIQDYKAIQNSSEGEILKRTMLMIAQMENTVEYFWSDIFRKMPKPEIGALGQTFAESEVRHMEAYSHLLEILGLNEEFKNIEQVEVIKERIEYLEDIIGRADFKDNKEYAQTIFSLSLFIENSSLLTLLMIIMSFNKFQNNFKGISNVAEATSKEEIIHFNGSSRIINIIKEENPEWFNKEYEEKIKSTIKEFYNKEEKVLDWIFEKGELSFINKEICKEFVKYRINTSLNNIGISDLFEVDQDKLEKTEWFEDELMITKHGDFFVKRSINYNKRSQSMTGDDLF